MGLRESDKLEPLSGKIVFVIGRSGSGKSSLIAACQNARPSIIGIDDHLRVRVGIMGASLRAYDSMLGLSFALAWQGFDVMCPCGGQSRELRDHLRSWIPSIRLIYIEERGRYYAGYEEPQDDENILIIPAGASTPEEVEMVMEDLSWKTQQLITG